MKKMLIAGNWKMNTDINTAKKLIIGIKSGIGDVSNDIEILVCPPYINIPIVKDEIKDTIIQIGAQNIHHHPNGAFTGEISIPMIKPFGCNYVIVGHSERREYYGETNQKVNEKVKEVLNNNLSIILCIGESLHERRSGHTTNLLTKQLKESLNNVEVDKIDSITIAYEPIWAIGTGVSADIYQVDEAHNHIREVLVEMFGESAKGIKLLYGGSVNKSNALEILSQKNVNGALVGGASLKADSFVSIVKEAQKVIKG